MPKLRTLGLGENVCKRVNTFLSDGKQRVVINGTSSNGVSAASGVTQGSVLGPLFFLKMLITHIYACTAPLHNWRRSLYGQCTAVTSAFL